MNTRNKIYVVEDIAITRLMIINTLEKNGYEIVGESNSAEKAWKEISKLSPNLVLLDINLYGEKDGLWLGKQIDQYLKIPFIYITAYQDQHTTNEILETHPIGFIVKPINAIQLITTINIALDRKQDNKSQMIRIQDGKKVLNLDMDDILYLQSEGNYVHIYMENTRLMVRNSLNNLLENFPKDKYLRIHLRTAINPQKEFIFSNNELILRGVKLSISNSYKQSVINTMHRKD